MTAGRGCRRCSWTSMWTASPAAASPWSSSQTCRSARRCLALPRPACIPPGGIGLRRAGPGLSCACCSGERGCQVLACCRPCFPWFCSAETRLSSYQPGCTLRTHCTTARGAARIASGDCTPARLCVTRGCGARAQRFLDLARGVDGVGYRFAKIDGISPVCPAPLFPTLPLPPRPGRQACLPHHQQAILQETLLLHVPGSGCISGGGGVENCMCSCPRTRQSCGTHGHSFSMRRATYRAQACGR